MPISCAQRHPRLDRFRALLLLVVFAAGVSAHMAQPADRHWLAGDSHVNYTELGSDFWPGQFHKTYVYARQTYEDVLDGLRAGRMFVVAGDLITELDLVVSSSGRTAEAGGTLRTTPTAPVAITIRFRDPETPNDRGTNPKVRRVDLIVGDIQDPAVDRNGDRNDTARVIARFEADRWAPSGDVYTITTTLPPLPRGAYVRVRGTSGIDPEPLMDTIGENPWSDLWFYSNPVFVEPEVKPSVP